jgi:hypothetical protein
MANRPGASLALCSNFSPPEHARAAALSPHRSERRPWASPQRKQPLRAASTWQEPELLRPGLTAPRGRRVLGERADFPGSLLVLPLTAFASVERAPRGKTWERAATEERATLSPAPVAQWIEQRVVRLRRSVCRFCAFRRVRGRLKRPTMRGSRRSAALVKRLRLSRL